MVVVAKHHWHFSAAARGESAWLASVGVNDKYVGTSFAGRGKGDVFSVGTPYGMCVVGGIRGQLLSFSSIGSHGEDIAFVCEGDTTSVR